MPLPSADCFPFRSASERTAASTTIVGRTRLTCRPPTRCRHTCFSPSVGKIPRRFPEIFRSRAENLSVVRLSVDGALALPLPCIRQSERNGATPMVTKERIEVVLERVRPFLQADGGDIELVAVE